MRKLSSSLVIAFVLLSQGAFAQTNAGEERGKQVGSIVKAAIDTALPGVTSLVQSVVEIVRPNRQVKERIESEAETKIKAVRAKFYEGLRDVSLVADELDTVNEFTLRTAQAAIELASIEMLLRGKSALSDSEWSQLRSSWRQVVSLLNIPVSEAAIRQNVKDVYVAAILEQVILAKSTSLERANSLVSDKASIQDIREAISELRPILAGVQSVAVVESRRLADDLRSLAKEASSGMGPSKKVELSPEEAELLDRTSTLLLPLAPAKDSGD